MPLYVTTQLAGVLPASRTSRRRRDTACIASHTSAFDQVLLCRKVTAVEQTISAVFAQLLPIFGWCHDASDPRTFLRLPCDVLEEVRRMTDAQLAHLAPAQQAQVRDAKRTLSEMYCNLGRTWLMSRELPSATMLERAGQHDSGCKAQVACLMGEVRQTQACVCPIASEPAGA